jgi:hypothetical protein
MKNMTAVYKIIIRSVESPFHTSTLSNSSISPLHDGKMTRA